MKLRLAILATAFLLGLVPAAAPAHDAYTAKRVHLRAGPARDYPVVAILPPGTALDVLGCLSDYSWCDVIAVGERGWIYAANIEYVYQGVPVPLIDYGPVIGITIFQFFLPDYWDRHYHGRPWYRHRDEWIHRPRPVQPPIVRPPKTIVPPHAQPPGRVAPPRAVAPPPMRAQPPRSAPPSPPPRVEPPRRVPPPRAVAPGAQEPAPIKPPKSAQ